MLKRRQRQARGRRATVKWPEWPDLANWLAGRAWWAVAGPCVALLCTLPLSCPNVAGRGSDTCGTVGVLTDPTRFPIPTGGVTGNAFRAFPPAGSVTHVGTRDGWESAFADRSRLSPDPVRFPVTSPSRIVTARERSRARGRARPVLPSDRPGRDPVQSGGRVEQIRGVGRAARLGEWGRQGPTRADWGGDRPDQPGSPVDINVYIDCIYPVWELGPKLAPPGPSWVAVNPNPPSP